MKTPTPAGYERKRVLARSLKAGDVDTNGRGGCGTFVRHFDPPADMLGATSFTGLTWKLPDGSLLDQVQSKSAGFTVDRPVK